MQYFIANIEIFLISLTLKKYKNKNFEEGSRHFYGQINFWSYVIWDNFLFHKLGSFMAWIDSWIVEPVIHWSCWFVFVVADLWFLATKWQSIRTNYVRNEMNLLAKYFHCN